MKNSKLQRLVNAYCDNPSQKLRGEIVKRSMGIVHDIVNKINRPDRPLTQKEDLLSAAIGGLLQSINTYDKEKGIQFNTFAYYRTQGAAVDYLRRVDSLSRSKRDQYGNIQEHTDKMAQVLGRTPSEKEVADQMNITRAQFRDTLARGNHRNTLSLDVDVNNTESGSYHELHYDPSAPTPHSDLEQKEVIKFFKNRIGQFKKKDQLVINLYFYKGTSMSKIAKRIGVTESSVSQRIKKLLKEIRWDLTYEYDLV